MQQLLRRRLTLIFVVAFVGLNGLINVIGHPRFQTYHLVDVIQLLASGVCFGVAIGLLRGALRGSDGA